MRGWRGWTLGQATELLTHCHVTSRPVINLNANVPVDCYEVPDRLREQMHLRAPASAFPWSSATGRRMDLDHTVPYTDTGSPGQTRIGNLGKLTRYEHRVKTHGRGWRHRQPEPGVHHWRTPTGYQFTVDHTGTHAGWVPTGPTTESAYERAFVWLLAST